MPGRTGLLFRFWIRGNCVRHHSNIPRGALYHSASPLCSFKYFRYG
nr:MAG TPA: hypothetical protein [Caudoviricetes sp.]